MQRKTVLDELRSTPGAGFMNKFLAWSGLGIILVVGLVLLPRIVETNDAGLITIRQKAITGTMNAFIKEGTFLQLFGDVTKYKRADVFYFSKNEGEGEDGFNEAINVRFNDGATAKVDGNIRFELPLVEDELIAIHRKFRSFDALVQQTIKQAVSESMILTAALMTAEESYTDKRALFAEMARDQITGGVFLTEAKIIETVDRKTGDVVKKSVPSIKRAPVPEGSPKGTLGEPLRKEAILSQYGIRVTQFVVKEIDYEDNVDAQITTKQQALMKTVAAKADAEKAVQDRLTEIEKGKMNVAKAQYEQEVLKIKAVTIAKQKLDVAKLDRLAAVEEKQKLILLGQGEATRRKLVIQADGALDKKLKAYVEVNRVWAENFAKYKGDVVPRIMTGGSGSQGGSNGWQNAANAIGFKALKDLSIDMKVTRGATK